MLSKLGFIPRDKYYSEVVSDRILHCHSWWWLDIKASRLNANFPQQGCYHKHWTPTGVSSLTPSLIHLLSCSVKRQPTLLLKVLFLPCHFKTKRFAHVDYIYQGKVTLNIPSSWCMILIAPFTNLDKPNHSANNPQWYSLVSLKHSHVCHQQFFWKIANHAKDIQVHYICSQSSHHSLGQM